MLIEFSIDADDVHFVPCVLDAIQEIKPFIDKLHDLWMNDEIMMELTCDIGAFSFSKDIWGFAFITCTPDNQICLKNIDAILEINPQFQKLVTNFDDYKTISN